MRKVISLLLVFMLLFTVSSYAQWQRNENDQGQDQDQGQMQGQGQLQGQAQGQGQGQMQGQAAISAQAQGQLANGEVSTTVTGDTSKDRTYAVAYPSLSGNEGRNEGNIYSVFGGVGLGQDEKYKALITQIQAVEASQSLSVDEKKIIVSKLFDKMVATNKTERFLGVLWETSGRNLLNGFGILSWDSFWKDGKTPIERLTTPRVRTDTEITGNQGNVNQ